MARKITGVDFRQLYESHLAGESVLALSKRIGISRRTIVHRWNRLGLRQRSYSDAQIVSNTHTSEDFRKARARAANDAARGRKCGFAERCRMALSIERNPPVITGSELRVFAALDETVISTQRACGPYNLDFCVDLSIAVECFGGNWHASGRHAARHHKRVEYILNAGFHLVEVWVTDGHLRRSGWVNALRYVVSRIKVSGSDPSAPRQYWVIRGNGEIWDSGKPENADKSFVPAPKRRRDSNGQYRSAP